MRKRDFEGSILDVSVILLTRQFVFAVGQYSPVTHPIWSFILSTQEIHSSDIPQQSVSSARNDTIAGILRRAVSRHPTKLALEFDGRNWTFSELEESVHRVAKRLVDAGQKKSNCVHRTQEQ